MGKQLINLINIFIILDIYTSILWCKGEGVNNNLESSGGEKHLPKSLGC